MSIRSVITRGFNISANSVAVRGFLAESASTAVAPPTGSDRVRPRPLLQVILIN